MGSGTEDVEETMVVTGTMAIVCVHLQHLEG